MTDAEIRLIAFRTILGEGIAKLSMSEAEIEATIKAAEPLANGLLRGFVPGDSSSSGNGGQCPDSVKKLQPGVALPFFIGQS